VTAYTKLFNSILGSTIWREDPVTKVVWVTMLAMADRDGVVEASIPGLAHFAGVAVEQAEAAVSKFLSPDPYSRSPEYQGRRIEPVDGGWHLLNHDKYRDKLSKEDIRERDRLRQQRRRDREARYPAGVTERDNRDKTEMSQEIQYSEAAPQALKPLLSNADASDDSDVSKALLSIWDYYIVEVGRNPKTYTFTPLRKRKGLARLNECLGKTKGNLTDAAALMKEAIDRMVASDFHMGRSEKTDGKRYIEWESHLFKTYEQMEKWWNR
jgi:hypothetical protein